MTKNLTIIYLVFFLVACMSCEQNQIDKVSEDAVDQFFLGDIDNFTKQLDSAGVVVVQTFLPQDSLEFETKHSVIFLTKKGSEGKITARFFHQCNDVVDTLRIDVVETKGHFLMKLDLDVLFQLTRCENKLSFNIAKKLFTKRSYSLSQKWFEHIKGEYEMEAIYYLGLIQKIAFNYDEALKLFNRSFQGGYDDALIEIATLQAINYGVDSVVVMLKKNASEGRSVAMSILGDYYNAMNPPSDATPLSSFKWYKMAVENGSIQAISKLGNSYQTGKISIPFASEGQEFTPNYDSAFFWYAKGASLGDYASMICLSDMYLDGIYVEKNFQKGWEFLELAAKVDKAYGYFCMGNVYRQGRGVAVDNVKALDYYRTSASEGFRLAEFEIEVIQKELKNIKP